VRGEHAHPIEGKRLAVSLFRDEPDLTHVPYCKRKTTQRVKTALTQPEPISPDCGHTIVAVFADAD
jgi:hypothetical protein